MKTALLIGSLVFCCAAAFAGPAPWYLWGSRLGDHYVCAQFSPGDGWVIIKGPFEDSGCRKPASGE